MKSRRCRIRPVLSIIFLIVVSSISLTAFADLECNRLSSREHLQINPFDLRAAPEPFKNSLYHNDDFIGRIDGDRYALASHLGHLPEIIDLKSGTIKKLAKDYTACKAYDPNYIVLRNTRENSLLLLNSKLEPAQQFTIPDPKVEVIGVSSQGQVVLQHRISKSKLFVTQLDGTYVELNLQTGDLDSYLKSIHVSTDGSQISYAADRKIRQFALLKNNSRITGLQLETIEYPDSIVNSKFLQFSPDGTHAIVKNPSRNGRQGSFDLLEFDLITHRTVRIESDSSEFTRISYSPDSRYLSFKANILYRASGLVNSVGQKVYLYDCQLHETLANDRWTGNLTNAPLMASSALTTFPDAIHQQPLTLFYNKQADKFEFRNLITAETVIR